MSSDGIRELCDLFARALELEYVTPETDFFLAGGHSLSALMLARSVQETFGIETRARDIYDCATPELLAARLAEAHGAAPAAAASAGEDRQVPGPAELPGQPVGQAVRWLWLARQQGRAGSSPYTVGCLLRGEGDLDVERLTSAVAALPSRHPGLATVFIEAQGTPRAVPGDRAAALEITDLRTRTITSAEFQEIVHDHVQFPFNLAMGPLFRTVLFLHPAAAWSLLFVADHLICDGRALEILAADVVDAYTHPLSEVAAVTGPEQPATSQPDQAALEYWRQRLSPPPAPLPLPISRPRLEPVASVTGTMECEVRPEAVEQLRRLARDAHAGLFVPLAAAVARALGELTGSADICLGTAVDRRFQLGLDSVVGFQIATVPLRLAVPPGVGARELAAHVAACTTDALDHSGVTFDEIVATLAPPVPPGRTPFFDVWVALYPAIDTGPASPGGIALRGGPVPLRQGVFELTFLFVEHTGGLRMVLLYDAHRYDADTVARMSQRVISDLEWLASSADTVAPRETQPAAQGKVFQGFRFGESDEGAS